jgi:tetratricopeptide (TPR) repeat protein
VAVAGPDLGTDAEAGLTSLLEQTLLRRLDGTDEPRFTMLATIREYALERLTVHGGADAARDRLADHILAIVDQANDELVRLRQAALLRLLDAELPNIRASLEWLHDRGDIVRLPCLAADLSRFWAMRGLRREGLGWIEAAAPMMTDASPEVQAYQWRAEGGLLNEMDSARALIFFEKAIAIHRASGNQLELARCLPGVTVACNVLVRLGECIQAAAEARDLAHETGDLRTEGSPSATSAGRPSSSAIRRGARLNRTAIDLLRRVGDIHGAVRNLSALAIQSRLSGDHAGALAQHLEALELARQVGDPEPIGLEVINTVIPLVKLGRWQEAVEPWLEGAALLQDNGIEWEQIAAISIAVSPLFAAGDIEGAASAWAMANALADERDIQIQPLDIDEQARSAIEAQTHEVNAPPRSLPEALVTVRSAFAALKGMTDDVIRHDDI